jgi:RHS repeat-associated protein
LYYFGARYYTPEMARFTQIDPLTLQLQSQRNLQGVLVDPWRYLHPYAYAANNPLTNVDLDGNFSMKAAARGLASGAWIGVQQTASGLAAIANDPTVIVTGIAEQYKQAYSDAKTLGSSFAADPGGTMNQISASFQWAGDAWNNLSEEQKWQIAGYALEKGGEAYLGARGALKVAGSTDGALSGATRSGQLTRSTVPNHALNVLGRLDRNGFQKIQGYEGGGIFENRPTKAGTVLLPKQSYGYYQEWDVNPFTTRAARGMERVVTGSNGEAWYTNEHYESFTRIR